MDEDGEERRPGGGGSVRRRRAERTAWPWRRPRFCDASNVAEGDRWRIRQLPRRLSSWSSLLLLSWISRAKRIKMIFFFFFGNLIHYNLSRANVEFFSEGKELSFEAWQLKMVRRGGDGAATAPPIDRPPCPPPHLPPPFPSPTLPGLVPDDETWKLENVSCISCWGARGGTSRLGAPKSNLRRQDYVRKYARC